MSSKREQIVKPRQRGRILTPEALAKLQQAIRDWEIKHDQRCTQERIKELTSRVKEGGLDPTTTRKILKAKDGVDPESIRCLFLTFGMQLTEAGLVPAVRLQVDPNFVGREGAIADLNTLVNRGVQVIVIQARGGVGKTTLARRYLQQEFGSFLDFPIAKETKDIASIESLIEEKLRQLGEEPGREFFVSLDRLKRRLQAERIGILIDNLEPALDSAGKFVEAHRRYVELLRVLADPTVRSITLITSRERLNEYSISVQHYLLGELSLAAWNQFFQNRVALFAGDRTIAETDSLALAALHKAYGGNAKAMDILCGTILTDYAGDIDAYWQANQADLLIERALEDLVVGQFDRLQQTEPDAYQLLCRMGCYRYQDVPTVPIEGLLCLLWDIPESRQRRVVKSLQERSLLEFAEGIYWLHPVIRSEAIARLREGANWQTANQQAAQFWTTHVQKIEGINDALKALEAYFHYLEIQDYQAAANVITKRRRNQWRHNLTLGDTFYRLGLLQQIYSAIQQVIPYIDSAHNLSLLYGNLGDVVRIWGNIQEAIDFQAKAEEKLNECIVRGMQLGEDVSRLKLQTLYSFLSRALYYIDLWELDVAENFLEKVLSIAEADPSIDSQTVSTKTLICLSYTKTYLGAIDEGHKLAEQALASLIRPKDTEIKGSLMYFLHFLGLTYLKLNHDEQAKELFAMVLAYTDQSQYIQTRARVLYGFAELYRRINQFDQALAYHSDSIELLSQLGAKGDLGEAHYQLGLTHQAMGDAKQSYENFQAAIQRFTEIQAPKQVERVSRSMNS